MIVYLSCSQGLGTNETIPAIYQNLLNGLLLSKPINGAPPSPLHESAWFRLTAHK